jgi:hypothetical protein
VMMVTTFGITRISEYQKGLIGMLFFIQLLLIK